MLRRETGLSARKSKVDRKQHDKPARFGKYAGCADSAVHIGGERGGENEG